MGVFVGRVIAFEDQEFGAHQAHLLLLTEMQGTSVQRAAMGVKGQPEKVMFP